MATSANDLNADHSSCAAWIARFLRREASIAFSACRAGTSSRSGTMPRSLAYASSTFATRPRRFIWRMLTPSLRANSASPW